MLLKLTSEQTSIHWGYIKYALSRSLPPTTNYSDIGALNIQKKLLNGQMQAWVYMNSDEEITGLMTTLIGFDPGTEEKHLLVYSLFVFGKTDNNAWIDSWNILNDWARGQGCRRILAYTNVPAIEKHLIKEVGASVDFKLISKEVI